MKLDRLALAGTLLGAALVFAPSAQARPHGDHPDTVAGGGGGGGDTTNAPEPFTLGGLAIAGGGLWLARRRKAKESKE